MSAASECRGISAVTATGKVMPARYEGEPITLLAAISCPRCGRPFTEWTLEDGLFSHVPVGESE